MALISTSWSRFFRLLSGGLFLLILSVSFSSLALADSYPKNVDMAKVRATWIGWYNTARQSAKLYAFTYNAQLDKTALSWSETAKKRGYMNHKRDGQTSYYDYNLVKKWFIAQGVTFGKATGTLVTENIGWSPYSCTKKDCTSEMIRAIRYTFDFYMAEKGKKYRPHYNSVMSSDYKQIGFGISVDEAKKKLYLTVHYAKSVDDPVRVVKKVAKAKKK